MATRTMIGFSAPVARRAPFGLRRAWAVLCVMVQARAERRLLAEMDARTLADIGASPSDAHMEASRPFWDIGGSLR